ncbi:sulfotransferase family 2 domain-containing protein [Thalassococcus sp. S3]|uniref:sulfotransferase family 2 domain-containing protein n=1 Tax=Thalassococcus sp. S3 TaxID=2017482 RepID=UPI0010246E6D|nr:sulfotransferase family 2 domain-containing protein [Thalassococcus sp. S3]QBF30757.1 hypothetical protein CFI11_05935 [Thalassococcus sp. S3]
MLVFSPQNLAFLAVPKTGTTAIEMALKSRADIIFTKRRKHMTAQRFHNQMAPFLAASFDLRPERIAVMREPEEQLRSWYRYRQRVDKDGAPRSTIGMSFDAFVQGLIDSDDPPFGGVGSQYRFLTSARGEVLVHRLFAYEHQPQFRAFLEDRFEEKLDIRQRNVSPTVEAPLDPATRTRLKERRADEFALYERVMSTDGPLLTSIG